MKNLENITEGNIQGLLMPRFGETREAWKAWFRWRDLLPLEENAGMQLLILKMPERFILSLHFFFFSSLPDKNSQLGCQKGNFLPELLTAGVQVSYWTSAGHPHAMVPLTWPQYF